MQTCCCCDGDTRTDDDDDDQHHHCYRDTLKILTTCFRKSMITQMSATVVGCSYWHQHDFIIQLVLVGSGFGVSRFGMELKTGV